MKKYNLILDLDQTLISAEPSEEFNFKKYQKKAETHFRFHGMDGYYIVFERPYLQKFLDYIFKNFNVSIWTAASQSYALFIIDKIILSKSGRKLDYIFFNYHCKLSKKNGKGSKDLSLLWNLYKLNGYSNKNTAILDDYDEVCRTQPCNCIVAQKFYFLDKGSYNDHFLLDLIPILKKLKQRMKKGKDIII